MSLDSSRWIFLKYQIFIIFSNRLVKLSKIKIVHWYVWQGQLCHLIWDGVSYINTPLVSGERGRKSPKENSYLLKFLSCVKEI
jgi:hypothetical protein